MKIKPIRLSICRSSKHDAHNYVNWAQEMKIGHSYIVVYVDGELRDILSVEIKNYKTTFKVPIDKEMLHKLIDRV